MLDGSPAGILQKGFRSERQWNNVIKTRTKHQLTGDEWRQMNRANVTKPHQNPDVGVLRLNSLNGLMSVNCGLPLKSPVGEKSNLRCCSNFWCEKEPPAELPNNRGVKKTAARRFPPHGSWPDRLLGDAHSKHYFIFLVNFVPQKCEDSGRS